VFLVDLYGLIKYTEENLKSGDKEYVIVPLMGRFKNEIGDQYHLTPLVATTESGLKVKLWIKHLVEVRKLENQEHGPAFSELNRHVVDSSRYEREILERFQFIQVQ
jgi:hypothetical protein